MNLWPFGGKKEKKALPLYFYNTLTKSKDEFLLPHWAKQVRMYNCGPTVYGRQHIGNLSMFVFTDILRRVLEYNDLPVRQVINFTDVGHLVSDADEGEDKMTKGMKNEGLELNVDNMKTLGKKYAELFKDDIRALNIDTDKITFPYASDHIQDDVAMIQTLEEKGYAYKTKKGVYFDTSRFPQYGKLGNIELTGLKEGARVAADPEKRNPTDFNLWKLNKKMGWNSPWGKGFPGWHIECSAMIHHHLGETIDIHTGGIEHIGTHHNNEIAQTEAATGRELARFWIHRAHLQLDGGKMAKSEGNVVYLSHIIERGFNPLSFRYLLLGAHYRTSASFTWEALEAAETTLARLHEAAQNAEGIGAVSASYQKKFQERMNDDVDTPGALAVMWEMLKDEDLSPADKRTTLLDFDRVLGLRIEEGALAVDRSVAIEDLPQEIQEKIRARTDARNEKNWGLSDSIRNELEDEGYLLEDAADGTRVSKK